MIQSIYEVSVIVVTYNPVWEKYRRTIISIIKQKHIKVEVILCDDGSKTDNLEQIKSLMEECSFIDYKIVKNKDNVGTVKNLFSGLEVAEGAYIYAISPGDYLYDENVLHDLYVFAMKDNKPIVFGDAVYYQDYDTRVMLAQGVNALPFNVNVFNQDVNMKKQFLGFMLCGNYILGATFFRRRDVALKYMRKIIGICKYVEDTSSSAYALADNVQHFHYNKYVVWYECETGISNNKNEKWTSLLEKDYAACYELLKRDFQEKKYVYNVASIKLMDSKKDKLVYLLKNDCWLIGYWLYLSIYKRFKSRMIHQHKINDGMMKFLYEEMEE